MLSSDELNEYISKIPPIPSIVKSCKDALVEGDLVKAADFAAQDKALLAYFQNIVNKPIFGFRDELTNARQIFGALGIDRTKQLLRSYYSLLLAPSDWEVFTINSATFQELQAEFIVKWELILDKKGVQNADIKALVTLIPAAIAVCEGIFSKHKDMVEMIKSQKDITYEQLLHKMSGYGFFDIVKIIAKKWEFSENILKLIDMTKNRKNSASSGIEKVIIYLILLINYEMSRPICMESGINGLFELNYIYPEEIVADFYNIISEDE